MYAALGRQSHHRSVADLEVKPEPPASKPEPPRLQLPDEADLNKVVGFMEKVWRRLVEMIAALQKEIQKKS